MMKSGQVELEGVMSPWLRGCIGVSIVIGAVSMLALAVVPLVKVLWGN